MFKAMSGTAPVHGNMGHIPGIGDALMGKCARWTMPDTIHAEYARPNAPLRIAAAIANIND